MAFITLLERKVLRYSQSRVGPNKPSAGGILQPVADAIKLFLKRNLSPRRNLFFRFFIRPGVMLALVLLLWLVRPNFNPRVFLEYSRIILLMILRVNVYPILLIGWGSNNKYSILGALRRVAQTISYEVALALILLILLVYLNSLKLDFLFEIKTYVKIILLVPFIFVMWFLSRLAETNRTPFDFAEGESELVSGFNTEYRSVLFAIIFMAEYGRIYFLAIIRALVFSWELKLVSFSLVVSILIFLWIWTRSTFPRYRYDLLINLAWKRILPVALALTFFSLGLIIY